MYGALQWSNTINAASRQYNLDPRLVAGVIQTESSGNPNALSSANAMGLMQLIPSTAAALGVSDPYDPTQNIYGGAALLRENIDRYGDVNTALLAYHGGTNQSNWGPLTRSYPGKVMDNIKLMFGNDPVISPVETLGGAGAIQQATISDYVSPDFGALAIGSGIPTVTETEAPTETETPWYRVDQHIYNLGSAAREKVVDAVSAPVQAAGGFALRGVALLGAIIIIGLGLYFLFQEEINGLITKAIPAGKAAKALAQ